MKTKISAKTGHFIDDQAIADVLAKSHAPASSEVLEILAKARELHGLSMADVATLSLVTDPGLLEELFHTARFVKESIYGRRMVLFAPLYISNLCANECLYCAFRAKNTAIKRRALSQEEIARETEILINQGHKRILMVAGEAYPKQEGFQYILDSIATIYKVKSGKGEIRRVNANLAPLSVEEFHLLREAKIGTFQIFQETYHRSTYAQMHQAGKKRDFDWRVTGMDRAMEGGVDDVGIGILFGLCDWRYEILAMLQHIAHLEDVFGVGPHTISVPRMEPATGSNVSIHPPHPVNDDDFRKIVAIFRLAVPYTGIIMSTRESARMRAETFALGVSQISAGSRTNPGGYSTEEDPMDSSQFSLGDHRPIDEVVLDLIHMGYIPSFCTGCYRLGRTGADFMDMAKPGLIKSHCDPNGVSTFMEYLLDYASAQTRQEGLALIDKILPTMPSLARERAENLAAQVKAGKRDVYC